MDSKGGFDGCRRIGPTSVRIEHTFIVTDAGVEFETILEK